MVPQGLDVVLREVCGLDASQPLDAQAIALIKQAEGTDQPSPVVGSGGEPPAGCRGGAPRLCLAVSP